MIWRAGEAGEARELATKSHYHARENHTNHAGETPTKSSEHNRSTVKEKQPRAFPHLSSHIPSFRGLRNSKRQSFFFNTSENVKTSPRLYDYVEFESSTAEENAEETATQKKQQR